MNRFLKNEFADVERRPVMSPPAAFRGRFSAGRRALCQVTNRMTESLEPFDHEAQTGRKMAVFRARWLKRRFAKVTKVTPKKRAAFLAELMVSANVTKTTVIRWLGRLILPVLDIIRVKIG